MDSDKQSRALRYIVILAIVIAIGATYWRSIIQEDFYVVPMDEESEDIV
jgi:hypothetical protein